ncbi:MAG: formylglycine-generating enzyme family protein [Verrucomicrobia bacterium]|nr:formylglycine-generating enzyme family protein [Verrucomicrobiota bacterium]
MKRSGHKLLSATCLIAGALLTSLTTQAAAPALSYEVTGNNLILTYTGTLLQSADAVNWTEVASASSPYKIALSDKKLFFCAKGEDTHDKDITISLSDTVNLDLIWIEPGTFMMGSPEDELGRWDDEIQHQVTLTKGYWLGKYEVTQAQYQMVIGTNPSSFTGDNNPVEQICWYDAKEFCEKLTALEEEAGRLPHGYEYTLPTEAQWEYACRAGTTTALNSGKNLSDMGRCPEMNEVGWYDYNSNDQTHPVGQKQPNAWGLYDMHGNVYEWCLDWFEAYPTSAMSDPVGPVVGVERIMRGGGCFSDARFCRSALRNYYTPNDAFNYTGFRVALAPVNMNITVSLLDTVILDMIWIEPGTFTMGSPESELGRSDDEIQHEVTLSEGYWMGKYEVTQAQYEAVTGRNPSNFKGADLPVEQISWNDAMDFCGKLTEIEKTAGRLPSGYEYTLPTEAQWEYACRAGTTTALNSGKNLSDMEECSEMDEVGWYLPNSNKTTHPVGQKQPNAWGLYDMHGNVWEWCLDWYGDYPTIAVTDPTGPSTGFRRVQRGACWDYNALLCRSANRNSFGPSLKGFNFGFRVALAPVK